ncbi:MAG TPA: hypothetical protein VE669_07045 [Actinomycetota bacterium]|nr:hypothetical protein [Actinomycetota bacterium]
MATIDHFLEGAATAVGFLVIGLALMVTTVTAMRARPRRGQPRPAHGER